MPVLHQHKQHVDRRRNEWQTPLGLVIAILATLLRPNLKRLSDSLRIRGPQFY
jgi:hypothetical protein